MIVDHIDSESTVILAILEHSDFSLAAFIKIPEPTTWLLVLLVGSVGLMRDADSHVSLSHVLYIRQAQTRHPKHSLLRVTNRRPFSSVSGAEGASLIVLLDFLELRHFI